jgi:2-iminobutanoate/2-iminopropanoate deaminase
MNRQVIKAPGAAALIAPFSPAIKTDQMVFVSGQMGFDASGSLKEGMKAQTRQCLENMTTLLSVAGSSLERVVKCTVFITNMDEFGPMNEVYAEFFPKEAPARSTVEVSRLAKGALVEIEAIALL